MLVWNPPVPRRCNWGAVFSYSSCQTWFFLRWIKDWLLSIGNIVADQRRCCLFSIPTWTCSRFIRVVLFLLQKCAPCSTARCSRSVFRNGPCTLPESSGKAGWAETGLWKDMYRGLSDRTGAVASWSFPRLVGHNVQPGWPAPPIAMAEVCCEGPMQEQQKTRGMRCKLIKLGV